MRKRDIWILIAAMGLAAGAAIWIFLSSAVATGAWGLRFRQEGQPPVGPAGADQLRQLDAAYLDTRGEKVIYLTFDAGYENGATEKILDTLKAQQVPAIFFLAGNYLQRNGDLVRRMVAEGHLVGNHTMHHRDMSALTDPEVFARELQELEALFLRLTGRELARYYRPPQGVYSQENLKLARELGYRTVFWSLAYVDWNNDAQPSQEAALAKLLPRIHDGAVVLLHCTSQTNAAILDQLITQWKAQGYRFAPISELFEN